MDSPNTPVTKNQPPDEVRQEPIDANAYEVSEPAVRTSVSRNRDARRDSEGLPRCDRQN